MEIIGTVPNSDNLVKLGFNKISKVHWNLSPSSLSEITVNKNMGVYTDSGAIAINTGKFTGRSPKDRFIVCDNKTEKTVWWGDINIPFEQKNFDLLYDKMMSYFEEKEIYVRDAYACSMEEYRLNLRVINEFPWSNQFASNMFIDPVENELADFNPEWHIINAPGFKADPKVDGTRQSNFAIINFTKKMILIGGTGYTGEIKKGIFSVLNFILPHEKNTLSMHCSANLGNNGDTAIFFGLSGTGKTTLSADPKRTLIGDDEHGWSENGVFNFEGGCYAKMIRLSKDAEPEIYETTKKVGTILENVVLNEETGELDLDDDTLAENTRGAYPLSFIPNSSETGRGPIPKNIILLTCDAFGVLPPIAKLSASQTMYHFLSGYTAKVAGTEKGVTEPEATFSACFGAPFMPRHPSEYGNLLKDLIHKYDVNCWLVNTGWSGGPVGEGDRMPIKATRALLSAALDGTLNSAEMRKDQFFGFEVPLLVDGVDETILVPRNTWSNKDNYDAQATKLVDMFINNFSIFEKHVDEDIMNAAPKINLS